MDYHLSPGQVADAMLAAGKFAWTPSPDYIPVIDLPGGRYLVCAGTGDAKRGFELAQDLNRRVHNAIRHALEDFAQEHGQPPRPAPTRPRSPHVAPGNGQAV